MTQPMPLFRYAGFAVRALTAGDLEHILKRPDEEQTSHQIRLTLREVGGAPWEPADRMKDPLPDVPAGVALALLKAQNEHAAPNEEDVVAAWKSAVHTPDGVSVTVDGDTYDLRTLTIKEFLKAMQSSGTSSAYAWFQMGRSIAVAINGAPVTSRTTFTARQRMTLRTLALQMVADAEGNGAGVEVVMA